MIRLSAFAALALCASAGLAAAQAPLSQNPPRETTICLDVNGQTLPVVCKAPGSRLDTRDDICVCPQGTRVQAPLCGPGERAPAENVAFERARRTAARDGSLLGDLFEGRPMCVAPPRR